MVWLPDSIAICTLYWTSNLTTVAMTCGICDSHTYIPQRIYIYNSIYEAKALYIFSPEPTYFA